MEVSEESFTRKGGGGCIALGTAPSQGLFGVFEVSTTFNELPWSGQIHCLLSLSEFSISLIISQGPVPALPGLVFD